MNTKKTYTHEMDPAVVPVSADDEEKKETNIDDEEIKKIKIDYYIYLKLIKNKYGKYIDIRRYYNDNPTKKGLRINVNIFK